MIAHAQSTALSAAKPALPQLPADASRQNVSTENATIAHGTIT